MREWKRIDSIAYVRRGASPRPIGDPKYFGGEVGWVRISDVTRSSRFLRETEQYLSPTGEALSVRVNPGDLVMSICGTLGRPIMIDMPACIHDGFVQFTNLRDIDISYLFYALQHAESAFCGMGQPGTQTNLNTSLVGRHTIFCPNTSEQRYIAEILSTMDEAIEQTEALIANMQQVKAGLMHDLFTRGVTPDGRLRRTREQAPDLYKESPLGWVPEEWEIKSIAAIAESLVDGPFGSNLKSEHYVVEPGVRVVRLQNIQVGNYNDYDPVYVSQRHADYLSRNAVNPGDVLIAALGDENYSVGRSCCYPLDLPPAINKADCFRLRCLPDVARNAYITHFFNTTSSRNQVKRFEQGVTRRRTNLGNLRRVVIALPTIDEQDRIIQRLLAVNKQVEAGESQVKKLRQQKQGLMHDLLTGSIRVVVNNNE